MNWASLGQAARDAAYNNAAAVANAPALIRARNEGSAAFRAAHAGHLDLAYGDASRLAFDIYPGTDQNAPCLIFIHGGYWQMNRREDFAVFAQGLTAQGWAVAMPGYSLAPAVSLTQIVHEIKSALDWFAVHRHAHGVSGKIVISGWSAGAQLAALMLDHPLVHAGLVISGVYELAPVADTYLNEKLKLTQQEVETLSPLRLPVDPKPLCVAYGTAELPALVDDSRNFFALRAKAGAPGSLLAVEGADHFTILHEMSAADGALVKAAMVLAQ
ncbi:MAG: alpha/beta hydrolase [Acidocella sp.]|nr:alpha/beta hydrolase [Acidocella sp.]